MSASDEDRCPVHGWQSVEERDTDGAMTQSGPRILRWVRLACGCSPSTDLGADYV